MKHCCYYTKLLTFFVAFSFLCSQLSNNNNVLVLVVEARLVHYHHNNNVINNNNNNNVRELFSSLEQSSVAASSPVYASTHHDDDDVDFHDGDGHGDDNDDGSDPNTSPAQHGPCIFDVTSYGAVGDGSTDDTAAFQDAWKAACAVESAVMLLPADGKFMITSSIFAGPCKPGLVLQIDGILMPPEGPECWPKSDSKKQWLVFYRLDGFTMNGTGTVEGNGHKWWELPCKPHRGPHGSTLPGPCDSPAMIRFFLSNNTRLSGLRIQNSPQFHIKFDGCDGVLIEKLQIESPHNSPNTDGIHVQDTTNVGIYNSMIANGDDCISIGPGCSAVDIKGVVCDHSHGISIGSLGAHNTRSCVSNITVRGALIKNSDNGVRIKTWQGGSGTVSDISFQDIQMENTTNSILIDQYYCLSKECRNQTSAVYLSGVSYNNIKGTYNNVRSAPIHFACSDAIPCTNITMSEVELLPAQGELVDDPFCWNAYGIQQTLTIPPIDCLQDGLPLSLGEAMVGAC